MSISNIKATLQMVTTDKIASGKDMRSIIAAVGQKISEKEYIEIKDFVDRCDSQSVDIEVEYSALAIFAALKKNTYI